MAFHALADYQNHVIGWLQWEQSSLGDGAVVRFPRIWMSSGECRVMEVSDVMPPLFVLPIFEKLEIIPSSEPMAPPLKQQRKKDLKRILHLGVNSCSQEIYRPEVAAEFVLKLTRDTYHPRLASEFPGYADIDAGARIAINDNEYGYWRHEIGYICKTFEFLSIPRPQSVFAMGRNGYVQPGQPDSPRKDLTGLLRPNANFGNLRVLDSRSTLVGFRGRQRMAAKCHVKGL